MSDAEASFEVTAIQAREAFGRAVKARRGDLPQKELARLLGEAIGRPTKFSKQSIVSAVEKGKAHVGIEDVFAFAVGLGITPGDLVLDWAEQFGADQLPGALVRRATVLQALDELNRAVRLATGDLVAAFNRDQFPSLQRGTHDREDVAALAHEAAALTAELMAMPKERRDLLFKLANLIQEEGQ